MKIISYVPRDSKGRFTNLRRKMFKVLIYQIILLSIVMNVWQFRQMYNIRCSVNSQVVGWFTSKEKCGELQSSWEDSAELARIQYLQSNNQ